MLSRPWRFMVMIAVAAAIPYAWFNERLTGSIKGSWQKISGAGSGNWGSTWPVSTGSSAIASDSRDPNAAPMGTSVHSIREVLHFNITPRWVTDHWPRISTIRAERDLVGLRVPLVTGTKLNDFAGSLTYYFDARQQLRRITLHGHTGDDTELVEIMSKYFGLLPEPNLGAGIYILRWNAKPMNVMRVSHAPIIREDDPHAKLIVELELNDIGAGYGLSPEFREILVPDQQVRAWST